MAHGVISGLNELLAGFKAIGGIEALLVTSPGGINIASLIPLGTNADTLAAMSSTLQNAGDLMITQLGKGHSKRVVVECEHSKLVIVGAGHKAQFVVLATENVNIGLLFLEMDKTAREIEELLN